MLTDMLFHSLCRSLMQFGKRHVLADLYSFKLVHAYFCLKSKVYRITDSMWRVCRKQGVYDKKSLVKTGAKSRQLSYSWRRMWQTDTKINVWIYSRLNEALGLHAFLSCSLLYLHYLLWVRCLPAQSMPLVRLNIWNQWIRYTVPALRWLLACWVWVQYYCCRVKIMEWKLQSSLFCLLRDSNSIWREGRIWSLTSLNSQEKRDKLYMQWHLKWLQQQNKAPWISPVLPCR